MQKELIRKHLNGDCSFEEEQQVFKILSTDDGLKILNELADEFWEGELSTEKIDDKKLFKKIIAKLPHNRFNYWRYVGYAACLLFLIIATYVIRKNNAQKNQIASSIPIEVISKFTTKGQKSTIMLSDGSKVILNALSTISYPKYFTDSTRNIELSGEAFFYVAKDKQRPFTVVTGNTKTTALGTSFNVNSRSSLQQISLATGKVLINTDNSDVFILEPGEALEVDLNAGSAHKFQFDVNKELSWKDGILYFEDTHIQEIANTLELWYNVKVEISNFQFSSIKYTGRFENTSLKHVLESMSFALDFNYVLEGKDVKIIFNKKPK